MLGDLNIAEPGALIGFAGPRVIEQTIRQSLPEGFQRSEFLLEHGFLDLVVERARDEGDAGALPAAPALRPPFLSAPSPGPDRAELAELRPPRRRPAGRGQARRSSAGSRLWASASGSTACAACSRRWTARSCISRRCWWRAATARARPRRCSPRWPAPPAIAPASTPRRIWRRSRSACASTAAPSAAIDWASCWRRWCSCAEHRLGQPHLLRSAHRGGLPAGSPPSASTWRWSRWGSAAGSTPPTCAIRCCR